jgi:hypothetical protein
LLGSHRFDGHEPPQQQAGSSSSHSSFCEEVFSRVAAVTGVADPGRGQRPRLQRMRRTGQIFWLLAYVPILVGITFFPPSPPNFRGLAQWEVVSSYSSATAPDSHGISCADPLFQARKELDPEVAACACRCKAFFAVIQLASRQTAGQVQ